jgi:hypothetical protein
MKKTKWLTICIVLALVMVMIWTLPILAQMRGKGQRGQGGVCGQGPGQGQGQEYGPGSATCPYYQGNQNVQGNWSNNPQTNPGRQGVRGGGRMYQPNTQPSAPPVTQ